MHIFIAVASDPLADWLAKAGPVGILAFVVAAFFKGWIVAGSQLDQMKTERDRAIELLYEHVGLTKRTVNVAVARLELDEKVLELQQTKEGTPSVVPRSP